MDLIFENSRRRAREILQTFKNFKKTLVNKIDTNSAFWLKYMSNSSKWIVLKCEFMDIKNNI